MFGAELHARIAKVGYGGDGGEEFGFGKLLIQEQKARSQGGDEVDLVGQPDARVVSEDLDGLVQAAGEVERLPFRQVGADCVEICDAVFNQRAVDRDIRIKVDACAPLVLYSRHDAGAERAERRVMVPVLAEIE